MGANVVRYFETANGGARRIVEHRRREKVSDDSRHLGYRYETTRRWLMVEEYDGSNWVEAYELGDYVEPDDAPHR